MARFYSKIYPELYLDIYIPPGVRYFLIQRPELKPQDGIPFELAYELVDMLQEFIEQTKVITTSPYGKTVFEKALEEAAQARNQHPFTPFITIPGYGAIEVQIQQCSACRNPMVDSFYADQARRAGWRITKAQQTPPVCTQCWDDGVQTFICDVCNLQRPYKELKFREKNGAELCIHCYESASVKDWDAAKRLYEYEDYDD